MDKAAETQLRNIENRTGRSAGELFEIVKKSDLKKHGQLRDMLKKDLGMGHGDANLIVHLALKSDGATASEGQNMPEILSGIYAGKKATLRPVHEAVMGAIKGLGPFEIAPKKGYLSLRRKKQFAMIGPGTRGRLAVGLNMKGVEPTDRLIAEPPGRMCQYQVFLTSVDEVDNDLLSWIRTAFESAA